MNFRITLLYMSFHLRDMIVIKLYRLTNNTLYERCQLALNFVSYIEYVLVHVVVCTVMAMSYKGASRMEETIATQKKRSVDLP